MTSLLKSNSEQVILSKPKRTSKAQSELNWFVCYTKARAERKVQIELTSRNIEVFLPLTKTLKVWRNRQKKLISQVLFPNYIFVKTCTHEACRITQMSNIITFINCSGKPSIVSDKEIEQIKAILCLGTDITVETNFTIGDKVKIVEGPFIGYEGILVEQRGDSRFGLQIKVLNQTVFMNISNSVLEKC